MAVESFEAAYRTLRREGHSGWGGESFGVRLDGWSAQLAAWRAELSPCRRMLEVGCGNGAVSALLAARGHSVMGVDIAPAAIAWARDEFARQGLIGEFLVADLARGLAELGDARFDLVVDGNCFHCLLGSERAIAFAAVRRLLARGGRFLLSSMCGGSGPGDPYRYRPPARALIDEVQSGGFAILVQRVTHHAWWDHLWLLTRTNE